MKCYLRSVYFRLTILALAATFIFYKAWDQLSEWYYQDRNLEFELPLLPLLLLLFLAVLNWTLEAVKWMVLTQDYQKGFKPAFLQTLQGVATSFFTPNRTGEFIGKVKSAPKGQRKKLAILSFVGSGFQLFCTLFFGIVAVFLLKHETIISNMGHHSVAVFAVLLSILLLSILVTTTYFRKIEKRLLTRYNSWLKGLLLLTNSQKSQALLLSAGRYLIFTSQFTIGLYIFEFEGSLISAYGSVMIFYLLSTFFPSTFLGEIGVRESVAIFLFSPFLNSPMLAVKASLLIWVINIMMPALIGTYLFLKPVPALSKAA